MKALSNEEPICTKETLVKDCRRLGITPDMNVMVHSSLSSIGWVLGGAPTVVEALFDAVGEKGTLAMPSASPNCGDPSTWENLTVPETRYDEIRELLPVFDPHVTPTSMGAIAECFRKWSGTVRSNHPLNSVCANGVAANDIVAKHALEISEGRGTPFEKLYDMDFRILLLGVGFNRCTALHFAESLVENRRLTISRFPIVKNGGRVWVEVRDMAYDNSTHFPIVGRQFVGQGKLSSGTIGCAESLLFSMRALVDFASTYFKRTL